MQRHVFINQFTHPVVVDFYGKRLTKAIVAVANAIADHLPNPFPSYEKIMQISKIKSKSTISAAIKFLKDNGFLKVEKFQGNRSVYKLMLIDASKLSKNTSPVCSTVQCTTESTVQFNSTVQLERAVQRTTENCTTESTASVLSTTSNALQNMNSTVLEDKKNLPKSDSTVSELKVQLVDFQKYSECTVSNNISNNIISNNIFTPISNLTPIDIYQSYSTVHPIASEAVQCTTENCTTESTVDCENKTIVQCTTESAVQKQAFFENGAPIPKRIPLPNETPEMAAYYDAQHQKRLNAHQASNTTISKPEPKTIKHKPETKEIEPTVKPEHDVLKDLLHILKLQNEKIDALTSKIESLEKTAAENKEDTLQAIAKLEDVMRNVGKQLKINNENGKATKASVDSVLDQNQQITRKLQQVVNLAPQISKQQNKKTDYSNFFSSTDLAALKAAREAAGTDEEQLHEWQQSQPEVLEAIARNAKINALNQARLNK
jgi:murein DD-endopeptidase MepM/ murein hydrolase activator NlpD